MNLKQNIPNSLSILRIVLSLLIPFVAQNKTLLFVIMLLCGLTDVLDGFIARRFNCQSQLGARLDSIGDFVFFLVLVLYFLVWRIDLIKENIVFLSAVIAVRLSSLIACRVKNRKAYTLHTIANKITGVVVFTGILISFIIEKRVIIEIILTVALVSAVEEQLIMITRDNPDINIKSIFDKKTGA